MVQNEIHPYYQEQEVVPYIQDLGIVVNGYSPFGGRGHTSELFADEVISAIAQDHGVTSAQVILRWNLQRGCGGKSGFQQSRSHLRKFRYFWF